jgi:molybdopterin-containing oxidoreductase family iron-sulfur binding subunit
MEKCTYCMQRINLARVETKLHDLDFIPDGFFQTACQQACPSNSIVFGDIYDYTSHDGKGSEVVAAKNDPRTFAMLAFLNVTPRTTYKVRVRNPNEAIRPRGENPFGHHGADGHHDDHADDHHTDAGPRISLPILTSTLSGALA